MSAPHDERRKHWLVRAETIRRLWMVFIAALAATVVVDFAAARHGDFGVDGTFGFFAWYGFVTCVAMIVGANALGQLLKREDTYYDDR